MNEDRRGAADETRNEYDFDEGVRGKAKGRAERTDRATALRQLLYAGTEEYVMELLAEGCISSGKAAGILDTSVHRIHELAKEHSIEAGADEEDYQRLREATAGLLG